MNISPDMEKLKMMQDVELTLGLGKIEYHNKNLGLAFIDQNLVYSIVVYEKSTKKEVLDWIQFIKLRT